MGKFVEIGALVEKDAGDRAYEKIYNLDGVELSSWRLVDQMIYLLAASLESLEKRH